MDDRTKLEKAFAIANDPRGHPMIREAAKRYVHRVSQRIGTNVEFATDPKYAEAYQRYTDAFRCTVQIKVGNITLPMKCKPLSVANHRQLDHIFKIYSDWPSILSAMQRCIGISNTELPT